MHSLFLLLPCSVVLATLLVSCVRSLLCFILLQAAVSENGKSCTKQSKYTSGLQKVKANVQGFDMEELQKGITIYPLLQEGVKRKALRKSEALLLKENLLYQ